MGVIDRKPIVGQSAEEDKLYTFSSKPSSPGERSPDILVRFQAVSRTQPCIAHQYCKLNSKAKLSLVRQNINHFFKNYFDDGFIFLSKTKEILRSKERCLTLFDILPKVPSIYNKRKDKEVPNDAFMYLDVQYKKINYEYDGTQEPIMCACVVFLYEASKVSHWAPEVLHEDLSANTIEGFCFIPTDIMSWKDKIVESRASSLHIHAACGAKKELELTLHQLPGKHNINHLRDQRGASPLHYAAQNGHIDACELLIATLGKELLYQRDLGDKTPLHCALYRRKIKTITYLLQLNSDLACRDSYGNSCFELLLKQTSKDLEFIIYKLQMDCVDDLLRFQLTWCSIIKGNKPLSKYLSKHLTKLDFNLNLGQSLLHIAVRMKDKDVIDSVMSKGGSLDCRDITGFLPFHIACMCGYSDIEKLYFNGMEDSDLCRGIQLAIRNRHFHICSSIDHLNLNLRIDEQTFAIILEALDSGLRNFNHKRVLPEKDLKTWENMAKHLLLLVAKDKITLNSYVFDCAYFGARETFDLLATQGADFDISDQMGRTPLHEACQMNHHSIVEYLIAAGVNPNKTDWRGSTPLHYACAKGNTQVAIALLSHPGVDAGVQDNCGRTPLLISALYKRQEIVQFLIRKDFQKINLHAVDVYGHSILHYTVNLTESTIELVLSHTASVERVEIRLKRGLKRWNDTSDYRAWLRNMTMTDFKISHVSGNLSTGSSRTGSAFKFQKEIQFWNFEQHSDSNQEAEQRVGKKSALKCIKCDKYVAHKKKKYVRLAGKHICIRNCKPAKPGDDGRRRMKVKPFYFHSFDYSENISPLIQAARAGQTNLIRRLNKYDHSYKDSLDSQNRSLLEYAVDQNSVVLLKTLFEVTPVIQHGLLHRILMQKSRSRKDTSRKALIEFLLSKGYSPEEILEAVEITHDIGSCAWRTDDRKPRCSRDCHLKAYTPLEVSVRNNEEELFKLLLDFTSNLQQNFLLNLLAYNGNVWMIESFLKKRTKLATLKEKETDIEKSEYLEIGHVLDIACSSKKMSTVLIQSLVKVTPDIFVNAYVTDPEEYSVQSRPDMEWNMLYEMTTLGKLMSKDHPLAKSKDGKEKIENAACFLIDSGIQLDILVNEYDTSSHVHGVCEAFMCAMQNGYYRAAVSLLEESGDVFWDCAMNINKCKIQNKFNKYSYPRLSRLPDPKRISENEHRFKHTNKFLSPFHYSKSEAEQFQRFSDTKRDFLKYHILLACEENVPETVLRELLRAGREFFDSWGYSAPEISLDEIHDDHFEEVCAITDPLCRLLICVCEIISAYSLFKKKYNVLRIFKLAPVLYPYVHLLDGNIFFEPINRGRGSLILQRCVDLAYRKCHSRKLKKIIFSENTNLLHLVSSGDSVDIVKTILKAETSIDIDSMADNGLRPVDVAAACASWNVYKLLCDSGALVSGQTLVACCATEKYLGMYTWTNHIHGFRYTERGIEKSRVKIVKDICDRDGIDLLYEHPEHGTALSNAAKNKYWEVLDFFNKKRWSVMKACLSTDGEFAAMLFRDGTDRLLTKVLQNIEKHIGSISRPSLQQIILQSSNRKTMTILNGIVNIICEKHTSHNWSDLLNLKDKYGMGALHYAASRGYSSPIYIWAERLGNVHFRETSKLDAFDSYTRTDSPVFYAIANQHWDIAICLLLNGSQPLFKKYVPDFYTKGRFHLKRTADKHEPACLSEKNFWTSSNEEKNLLRIDWIEKRSFPQQVNSSKLVSTCLIHGDKKENGTGFPAVGKTLVIPKYKYQYERIDYSDHDRVKKKYVKYILKLARIASKNNCGLIHVACGIGDIELVQRIIKTHPSAAEAEDVDGIKPFIYAVAGGNIQIIDLMRSHLNHKNIEEALRVLIWKGVLKDVENAKHPVLNDRFKQITTNNKIYVDQRKFKIIFSFLSSFELDDEFGSKTDDNISQDYSNLVLFERLREVRDKICTSRLSRRWTSVCFSNTNGTRPELFEELYLLELFTYVFTDSDPRKLDTTIVLSIIALGRPHVLEQLFQKWKSEDEMLTTLEKPLIGNFSVLDCLIFCIEPYFIRTSSLGYYFDQYRRLVEDIVSKTNVKLNPEVAIVAIKKKQWILFEPIARKIFRQKGVELSPYWLSVFKASVEDGELSFLKIILELLGLPKMNEEGKQIFVPFLYLACLRGKSDIVKYFLRYSVPIASIRDELLMLDILGQHYKGSWTILHYAVKSNSSDVLNIILKSCRYDRLLLQSISLEEIFELAIGCKDTSIFYILKEYFEETIEATLTLTQQEKLLILSAQKGYRSFCKYFIEQDNISVFNVGIENMNTLHFSSLYDMRDVAEMIMKKSPDVIKMRDAYGFTPLDYAYALGNIYLVNCFVLRKDVDISPSKELFFEGFGWLRRLLETNTEKQEHKNPDDCRKTITIDKGLCLEGLIFRSDDHAAALFIESSKYMLEIRLNENVNVYGKLIHLAVRFDCSNSLDALLRLVNQDSLLKILTMNYDNMTPMAWAVKMTSLKCLKRISKYDRDKTGKFWKAPITEENLLHIAVKTGHLEIVQFIDTWTEGLLRATPDKGSLTPIASACALGFQYLLPSLCDQKIKNDAHTQHYGRKLDFTCEECLLDLGIGWSKNLQNQTISTDGTGFKIIARPVKRVISSRGMTKLREYQFHGKSMWIGDSDRKQDWLKWFKGKPVDKSFKNYLVKTRRVHAMIPILEWCRFDIENPFIAAFMFSMGYISDESSVLQFIFSLQKQRSTTCPPLKMLRLRMQANPIVSTDVETDIAISFFEAAAASGDKAFFDSNTEKFNALSSSINEAFTRDNDRLSLSEIAFGFGHYEVAKYLDDELTRFGLHGIHRTLHDMRSVLPQKVLWALKLELPGDDSWQIETEIVKRSCRLTKADIWLTTAYPSNVVHDIEQDVVSDAVIPVKCANKKFNPDVDGFGKQSCFHGKSNIWIRCLLASSIVYGHIYDILKMDESKYMTVTSIRITCIPTGTGDHAKTVIEQNGTYIESVGLNVIQESVVLQNDSTQFTRFSEARLRDSIQHQVIPNIQEKIQKVFGLEVSIKIDWRSVDSQKRTSGSDLILRLLSDESGNSLAGLEDVLCHCEEMKNDITNMFNHHTAKLAIQPISSIKEIVIKYVDTLPDLETVFQRKFTTTQKTGFWHFSIERSTLKYDRTTFKFWHYIHLYHGTCISMLDAVRRISSANMQPKKKTTLTTKSKSKKMKPLTLEIDWNSFGAHDPYVVHKLITQNVAREVLAIAHHCEAMFHLKLSGEHVIIQNTTSSKYTGVTPIFKLLTVSVYAHLMKNKNWEVSIENTFTRLCELEDKELSCNLTSHFWPNIMKKLHKVQDSISTESGIPVRIFIDEKRFFNLIFNKSRRDMIHPKTLVYKSIANLFDRLPCLYNNVLDNILRSTSSTFCIIVSNFDVPSAVWTDMKDFNRTRFKNQKLLVSCKRHNMKIESDAACFRLVTPDELTSVAGRILHGPWSMQPIQNCFTETRSIDSIKYVSFNNSLYRVLDPVAMLNVFSAIQLKFVLHELLFDHLESFSELRLVDKFFPNPVRALTELSPQPHVVNLGQYLKEEFKKKRLMPCTVVKQLEIDWKSFYANSENSHDALRNLLNSVMSFVSSYLHFAKQFNLEKGAYPFCQLQMQIQTLLCNTIKKLRFYIKMKSSIADNSGDLNKRRQKRNPDIHLVSSTKLLISFTDCPLLESFSDNIQTAIISILELDMTNQLNCENETPEEERAKSVYITPTCVPHVFRSKPHLNIVLQSHIQLSKAISEINDTVHKAVLNQLHFIKEVCYHKSRTSKTTMKYDDGVLRILVAPNDMNHSTFVRELHKIPEVKEHIQNVSNGRILYQMSGDSLFFACKNLNTIKLGATDMLGNKPDVFLLEANANASFFRICLWQEIPKNNGEENFISQETEAANVDESNHEKQCQLNELKETGSKAESIHLAPELSVKTHDHQNDNERLHETKEKIPPEKISQIEIPDKETLFQAFKTEETANNQGDNYMTQKTKSKLASKSEPMVTEDENLTGGQSKKESYERTEIKDIDDNNTVEYLVLKAENTSQKQPEETEMSIESDIKYLLHTLISEIDLKDGENNFRDNGALDTFSTDRVNRDNDRNEIDCAVGSVYADQCENRESDIRDILDTLIDDISLKDGKNNSRGDFALDKFATDNVNKESDRYEMDRVVGNQDAEQCQNTESDIRDLLHALIDDISLKNDENNFTGDFGLDTFATDNVNTENDRKQVDLVVRNPDADQFEYENNRIETDNSREESEKGSKEIDQNDKNLEIDAAKDQTRVDPQAENVENNKVDPEKDTFTNDLNETELIGCSKDVKMENIVIDTSGTDVKHNDRDINIEKIFSVENASKCKSVELDSDNITISGTSEKGTDSTNESKLETDHKQTHKNTIPFFNKNQSQRRNGDNTVQRMHMTELIPDELKIINGQVHIKWNGAVCNFSGKTKLELEHFGRKLNIPQTIHIFEDTVVSNSASYLGSVHGVRIEKDGFMVVFLEHDLCTHNEVQPHDNDPYVEVCKQKHMPFVSKCFKSSEDEGIQVQFHIFTSPKKYGKGKVLPIIFKPLSVLQEQSNWKWMYLIRCNDPARQTRIRASCRLCKRFLKIATPFSSVHPGKELIINSVSE